ncbi:hypothetical protein FA13DRAFT_173351 [Coprinellus micaceus]|uniref:Uncharacterized protein n=1 Tax=Coprinellus micaceus TaxID=71717 RepID=A0A4Y7SGH1_COPMI|nr:hypothetical protein FA13DRAFT_173351 [Coprinellus micaceus]
MPCAGIMNVCREVPTTSRPCIIAVRNAYIVWRRGDRRRVYPGAISLLILACSLAKSTCSRGEPHCGILTTEAWRQLATTHPNLPSSLEHNPQSAQRSEDVNANYVNTPPRFAPQAPRNDTAGMSATYCAIDQANPF